MAGKKLAGHGTAPEIASDCIAMIGAIKRKRKAADAARKKQRAADAAYALGKDSCRIVTLQYGAKVRKWGSDTRQVPERTPHCVSCLSLLC